jgi:taurine transport system permease protein
VPNLNGALALVALFVSSAQAFNLVTPEFGLPRLMVDMFLLALLLNTVAASHDLDPFISLLRPLPSITWIPLTILWLGIGEQQKVAIVFLGSWIYILFYTLSAVQRVDPLLVRAARNLGAGDGAVMWQVILPAALPGIIDGMKITLAISWSCVLSAELVAAQSGLGALIWQGKDWGNLPLVLVGMVAISITVLIADAIAERIERLLLPWERHRRS